MFDLTLKLAGTSQPGCQENIKKYGGPGVSYLLIREAENPHDPNAIKVSLGGFSDLGYIPAPIAKKIAPMMDSGRQLYAEFFRINKSPDHEQVGITVRIVENINFN